MKISSLHIPQSNEIAQTGIKFKKKNSSLVILDAWVLSAKTNSQKRYSCSGTLLCTCLCKRLAIPNHLQSDNSGQPTRSPPFLFKNCNKPLKFWKKIKGVRGSQRLNFSTAPPTHPRRRWPRRHSTSSRKTLGNGWVYSRGWSKPGLSGEGMRQSPCPSKQSPTSTSSVGTIRSPGTCNVNCPSSASL